MKAIVAVPFPEGEAGQDWGGCRMLEPSRGCAADHQADFSFHELPGAFDCQSTVLVQGRVNISQGSVWVPKKFYFSTNVGQ